MLICSNCQAAFFSQIGLETHPCINPDSEHHKLPSGIFQIDTNTDRCYTRNPEFKIDRNIMEVIYILEKKYEDTK